MGTVWRLQTRTDSKDGKKISTYCREESIAAVGWSINDDQIKKYNAEAFDKIQSIRASIKSKDFYYKVLEEYNLFNIKAGKKIVAVETLERVKPGDYIWMRDNGIYYLGYVGNNLRYKYNPSIDALEHDAANQIEDVDWKPIGDESQVPGVIATAFIRGRTLQRVRKAYMYEYASFIYNGKPLDVNVESNESLKQLFYNCLSPSDCEDLVCLYLYDKANYIAIPSTNKIATELYECVLVNPETGMFAYPQVKKGNVDLNFANYIDLVDNHKRNKEVYLFTSEGMIDKSTIQSDFIHIITAKELYLWVKSKIGSKCYLNPEGIVKWYKLIHSSKNS